MTRTYRPVPRRHALGRRTTSLAGVGLVAALALTGCGQLRPGAAAVVGSDRIALSQISDQSDQAKADPAVATVYDKDPAAFERTQLARLVNSELLHRLADKLGVSLDRATVAQRRQEFTDQYGSVADLQAAAAQNGLTEQGLQTFLEDAVLADEVRLALTKDVPVSQAQLQQAYTQNIAEFDKVTAAHILVADKATADMILAQVQADPSKFAALAKKYSTDTGTKDDGGDLGTFGKGKFVSDFEQPVFAAKAGSIIEVQSQFGWHIVRIDSHTTTTLVQATPQLRLIVLAKQSQTALNDAITALTKKIGVSINPRFGSYDPASSAIVAGPRPAISPAAGAASAAPAVPAAQG